ncbi:thioredoxin family protein [Variovorax sp. VNK109]|uniref:thioredoxin family protein n=1 Tax=Variovorax sp. VNK109 TaxID=3400919 RepID=UPI003C0DC7AA
MTASLPVPDATPAVAATPPARRLLVCLCAEWCGTCREYRPLFDEVAARHAGLHVLWVDIEDEADLVGDVEVETFPTLLIADVADASATPRVRFFGPLTPHAQTLARLVESLDAGTASEAAGISQDVRDLAARLAGWSPSA